MAQFDNMQIEKFTRLNSENDAAGDFFWNSENVNDLLLGDASLDAIGLNGAPVAGSATAGGVLQIFSGGSGTAGAAAFMGEKGLYLKHDGAYTSGNDFGVHRGFHLDFTYDINSAGGFVLNTVSPFAVELDLDITAGTVLGANGRAILFDITAGASYPMGGPVSPATSSILYSVVHPTTTVGNVPTDGYVGYNIDVTPGGGIATSVIGVQYRYASRVTGSGNSGTALSVNWLGASSFTGRAKGLEMTFTPQSGAASYSGLRVAHSAGTLPSLDVCSTVVGPWHIVTNNSLIAAAGAPNASGVTSGHLSFTDGTANLYVGDEAEIDGELFADAAYSGAIETITSSDTLDATHQTVWADCTSGAITATLPAASGCTGRIYTIVKIDSTANAVTIDGNGSETINGSTTVVYAVQWTSITVQSNGTSWSII